MASHRSSFRSFSEPITVPFLIQSPTTSSCISHTKQKLICKTYNANNVFYNVFFFLLKTYNAKTVLHNEATRPSFLLFFAGSRCQITNICLRPKPACMMLPLHEQILIAVFCLFYISIKYLIYFIFIFSNAYHIHEFIIHFTPGRKQTGCNHVVLVIQC